MTLESIEAAFDEWRKTLAINPSNLEIFAQGYVAGWNAKESEALQHRPDGSIEIKFK